MAKIQLDIVTPEKRVVSIDVDESGHVRDAAAKDALQEAMNDLKPRTKSQ